MWLTDGSCIRLRPEKKDLVWSYDMAMTRTADGRPIRMLVLIDEYTRECLSIHVARSIKHQNVLDQLYDLFICRDTRTYSFRQRAGIHCQSSEKVVGESRSKNPVHRTWKPLGEWLRGVIHREAQGLVAESRDL